VDSAVEANPFLGIAVVATSALNGIAVVRAYFFLFTGARHISTVSLAIGLRERIAVLTLSGLILGGGIFPQLGVSSRQRAAEEILQDRWERPSIDHTVSTSGNAPARVGRASDAGARPPS
jgi:NADH-quinone oxidoreductase subunit M